MSNLYSTYDSANHYEVAFHACPTNLRIIQAKIRKAKSRGGNSVNGLLHFGDGKTVSGAANIAPGDGKLRFWRTVFLTWGREVSIKIRACGPPYPVRSLRLLRIFHSVRIRVNLSGPSLPCISCISFLSCKSCVSSKSVFRPKDVSWMMDLSEPGAVATGFLKVLETREETHFLPVVFPPLKKKE